MLIIRAAKLADIEGIKQIYAAAAGSDATCKDDEWQRLIATGGILVAESENQLAGFGSIEVQVTEQVKYLYVAPEFQKAGIGAKLLDSLEAIGRKAGLQSIMLHANPSAVAFYRRAGYNPVESPIHHDHDGVEMMKLL